jgi:predicted nucleotidyltransferase
LGCVPERLLRILKSFVKMAKSELGDVEVYLFGSYARCEWVEDSDVDLVVVSDAFKGLDIGKRYALLRRMLPHDMAFEILAYTRE